MVEVIIRIQNPGEIDEAKELANDISKSYNYPTNIQNESSDDECEIIVRVKINSDNHGICIRNDIIKTLENRTNSFFVSKINRSPSLTIAQSKMEDAMK